MQALSFCCVLPLLFNAATVQARPWEVPKVPYYDIPGVPSYDTIPQDIPGLAEWEQSVRNWQNGQPNSVPYVPVVVQPPPPASASPPPIVQSPPPVVQSPPPVVQSPPPVQNPPPASPQAGAYNQQAASSSSSSASASSTDGVRRPYNFLASGPGENVQLNNGTVSVGGGPGTTIDGQYYGAQPGDTPYTVPSNSFTTYNVQPGSSSSSAPSSQGTSPAGGGQIYKATITSYGAGDSFGSQNCATNANACGFLIDPKAGFAAAASEALYGVIGAGGAGGTNCGACVRITGNADSNGTPKTFNSIVLKINNLCPRQGNSLCAQQTLSDVNQLGANVNIDICKDSYSNGVSSTMAFFGQEAGGLAQGTAQIVPCAGNWAG